MRFYPQQKTRSLRPQGRLEDQEIRARSPLAAWRGLQPLHRLTGTALRVGAKLVAGGYGAAVDESVIAALGPYHLVSVAE